MTTDHVSQAPVTTSGLGGWGEGRVRFSNPKKLQSLGISNSLFCASKRKKKSDAPDLLQQKKAKILSTGREEKPIPSENFNGRCTKTL